MNLRHILLHTVAIATVIPVSAQSGAFNDILGNVTESAPVPAAKIAGMNAELDSEKASQILPNPEIEFEHLWNGNGGENRWSAGISQELAWPGSYSARSGVISAMTEAWSARAESARISARASAAKLLIDIIAANKEIAILSEINESMTLLHEKIMKAWNCGEATILDVNKIKIETLRTSTRLQTARNTLCALTAELNALTGNADLTVPSDLEYPAATLLPISDYETALHQSPYWREVALNREVAERNIALSKSEKLPGFSIGYNHAYEDGTHFNGFSIAMTLPMWSRKHSVSAAQNNALSARFDAIARTGELTAQLHANHAIATSLQQQLQEFAPAVEGSNNLILLEKAYNGGELNLLNYLQEVNYFLEARLDYLSLQKEYIQLLAALSIPLCINF